MALGKISKQELSEELYNSLVKQTDMNISTTPADVEISGRTLVNLLGRAGSAIYKQFDGGHSYGTVGYENDAYTLTNTDTHGWITTLGTSHTFTKDKYYVVISDIYLVSGDNAYVSIVSKVPFENTSLFSTTEKGIWKTCCYRCKMGDPADGHPKPYFSMVVAGSDKTPSAKFKNARVYEITEAEYNALDGLTREQIGEKYPYVDDVKCVVNPYVECNENLLEDANWGLISATSTNPENPLTYSDSGIICATYVSLEAEREYTINIENQGIFQASFQLPNGVDLINPEQSPTGIVNTRTIRTTNDRTTLVLLINADNPTNATAKDIMNKITAKDIKVTVTKGSTPKSYDECHNSRVMFETKLYDGEKITRANDGSYVKNSEWGEDSPLNHINSNINPLASAQGYKCLIFPDWTYHTNTGLDGSDTFCHLIRYDGSMVANPINSPPTWYSSNECFHFGGSGIGVSNCMYLTLPNALTGWGDSYTPTAEEIRAFFLGWKMYCTDTKGEYNGTGTKRWAKLWCGIGERDANAFLTNVITGSGTYVCPTVMNDQGYTPYKLIYKKVTPTIEEVKTHGSLVVKDGVSTSVGSGLVLGELFNKYTFNNYNWVNGGILHGDALKYRVEECLSVNNSKGQIYSIEKLEHGMGTPDQIVQGNGKCRYITNNSCIDYVDYMIDTRDVVKSFSHTITAPKTTKEILSKAIEELSNTNEKLSTENRELKNKIESLPQVSNPNLLINGDFQVWQRGTSFSSSATEYSADRWVKTNVTITKVSNGAKVKANVSGQWIVQRIGRTSGYLSSYMNSNITISSKIDGKVYTYTTVCKDGVVNSSSIMDFVSFDYGDNTDNCGYGYLRVKFHDTLEHIVEWVKIEIGDKATPFTPRPYAEELTMCQRYYEVGTIYAQTDSTFRQYLTGSTFKTEKRVVPTVTIVNGSVSDLNGVISTNIILHTNGGASINGINLVRTSDNSNIFSSGKIYTYKYTADAEIY